MQTEDNSVIEQIKKEDDPFKKGHLIESLRKSGMRTNEIGASLGMQSSNVCHLLRILRLPGLIVDGYYSHLLSLSHLFIISRLKSQDSMIAAYESILSKSLTAFQTEQLVREELFNITTSGTRIPTEELYTSAFEFHEAVPEATMSVIQTRVRGKITIEIKGNPDVSGPILRGIMEKLNRGIGKKPKIQHLPDENQPETDLPSDPSSVVGNTDTALGQ